MHMQLQLHDYITINKGSKYFKRVNLHSANYSALIGRNIDPKSQLPRSRSFRVIALKVDIGILKIINQLEIGKNHMEQFWCPH